jgi:hypothetical protein
MCPGRRCYLQLSEEKKRSVCSDPALAGLAHGARPTAHVLLAAGLIRLAISQVIQFELTELTAKTQFSQSVLEAAGR